MSTLDLTAPQSMYAHGPTNREYTAGVAFTTPATTTRTTLDTIPFPNIPGKSIKRVPRFRSQFDVGDNLPVPPPPYNDSKLLYSHQPPVIVPSSRTAIQKPLSAKGADSGITPWPLLTNVHAEPLTGPKPQPVRASVEQADPEMLSLLPLLPRLIESRGSPATLKKTRDRERDVRPDQTQRQPERVRQNAVSTPMRLFKPPTRGHSPSAPSGQRGRSTSAQPPINKNDYSQSRQPVTLRPGHATTYVSDNRACSDETHFARKVDSQSPNRAMGRSQQRRTWLPGNRFRSRSHEPSVVKLSPAWILGPDSHSDYNIEYLLKGEKVPELWDDSGSLHVYLSSHGYGQGASFKVHMSLVEQSRVLSELVQKQPTSSASARSRARSYGGRESLTAAHAYRTHTFEASPPLSSDEARLYLPTNNYRGLNGAPDVDRLVALRNLFAHLTGLPLVGTPNFPTVYDALLQVANLLCEYEFGFATGSRKSFGDAVDRSTGFITKLAGLSDLRFSHEKTLEALVLGEQLRYWPLYNEAFCHAVGKYPALRDIKASRVWDRISPNTLQRLERAHLDMLSRQDSVNTRLEQFEFPSLFAGVANSTSNEDYRNIRFKNWRASFMEMRAFVLRYYKYQFGSWPPKANSRRNVFSESGLNRLVLNTLYADLCSVYDLLVNRNSATTRTGEDGTTTAPTSTSPTSSVEGPPADATMMALRQILNEFDQSSPPVLPPMPYDTPKLPTMATIHETYPNMAPKDQARFDKNVQPYELQLVMFKSHNVDAERSNESPFLAAFEAFELREAKRGKSEIELSEMRIGHWLFLYVVLQSMPMLVVDAPGLQYTEGVEYFLCEPPQGRAPWVEDAGEMRKAWFQTAGGAGRLVELSADVLLYSVEATYYRSHCWLVAKKWSSETAKRSVSVASVAAGGTPDVSRSSSLGMSSSSPSVVTMATLVSAADTSTTGSVSATSSPRIQPTSCDEAIDDNDVSPRSLSPAGSDSLPSQKPVSNQHSPQLQPTQQIQSAIRTQSSKNLPWAQNCDSYHQPQERDRLRHASTGWALEPVNLSNEDDTPSYHPAAHHSRTFPVLRRNFSGGRSMMESGNNHDSADGASQNTKPTYNAQSTFDAILGRIDTSNSLAAPKKKRRNSFLPFI